MFIHFTNLNNIFTNVVIHCRPIQVHFRCTSFHQIIVSLLFALFARVKVFAAHALIRSPKPNPSSLLRQASLGKRSFCETQTGVSTFLGLADVQLFPTSLHLPPGFKACYLMELMLRLRCLFRLRPRPRLDLRRLRTELWTCSQPWLWKEKNWFSWEILCWKPYPLTQQMFFNILVPGKRGECPKMWPTLIIKHLLTSAMWWWSWPCLGSSAAKTASSKTSLTPTPVRAEHSV